ncbi:hypothetical protein [Microbacterium aerolatum]|uniref:hypothetical protein n=1 Tax=Microbacterium aerolatum TaxID=153731 RepID=UPI00384AD2A1
MKHAHNLGSTLKLLASIGFVATVCAFASWLMMWLLVTQARAADWSQRGFGESQLDFLIRSQGSYSSQIGFILGAVAAVLFAVLLRFLHVGSRFRRLVLAVGTAAPFAYIINVLCAGLSNVGIQVAFVVGVLAPLALSLYLVSIFFGARNRPKASTAP